MSISILTSILTPAVEFQQVVSASCIAIYGWIKAQHLGKSCRKKMHPALLCSQCKTGSEAGCSKAAGSGAENACVQEWSMDIDIHLTESWLSLVLKKTPNLNLRMPYNGELLSKLSLLKFTPTVWRASCSCRMCQVTASPSFF